jgi:Tetratricopeptide repeat
LVNALIDVLITFLTEIRAMSLVSQLLAIIPLLVFLAALAALPAWRMKRKAEASVTQIDGLQLQLKTAREVATKHAATCDQLHAESPEAFLAAHAREMQEHNAESAMALAETFIDRQQEALSLAFRTRMDEAIGQSPQDGAPAFETALIWARAALALAPGDREMRMLIGDLKGAAAIAAQSPVTEKLRDDADRQARQQSQDRLPMDIDALTTAFIKARDGGHFALMLFLAGHGLTITRRPPFGQGSTAHLLFRRRRAEALRLGGQAQEALVECLALAQPFQEIFGNRAVETLYLRNLQAWCRADTGDPAAALAEIEDLLPLWTQVEGPRHPSVLATRYLQAECRADTGDPAAALAEIEDLLPLRTEVRGSRHPDVLATRYLQARCRADTGDPAAALEELEDLLPLITEVRGPRHPSVLATRLLRAECLADLDEPDQAAADLEDIGAGLLAARLLPGHKYNVRLAALKERLADPRE